MSESKNESNDCRYCSTGLREHNIAIIVLEMYYIPVRIAFDTAP